MTGAWVSELSSPSGSKSDPSAGHVSWISIYFLIGVPELGNVLGSFFSSTEGLDFGSGCVQKNKIFSENVYFLSKKWLMMRALVTKN